MAKGDRGEAPPRRDDESPQEAGPWRRRAARERPAVSGPQDRDSVTVWWLPVEDVDDAAWPLLESLLDEDERERAARFHFERDRLVYIAAHALARGLLSWTTGRHPRDWRFAVGEHGKPEVCPPGEARLRLNLSHTRGLAAAALAIDHDVGVDVEWLQRRTPADELAARFFASSECAALAAEAPERKTETFLSFWTLKEAYIKAIGKGLAQPLDSFAFTLEPPTIRFAEGVADEPAHWLFRRLRPTAAHLMALAVRHPEPPRLAVSMAPADLGYLLDLGRGQVPPRRCGG